MMRDTEEKIYGGRKNPFCLYTTHCDLGAGAAGATGEVGALGATGAAGARIGTGAGAGGADEEAVIVRAAV